MDDSPRWRRLAVVALVALVVCSTAATPAVAALTTDVADHDPPVIQQRQTFVKDDIDGRVTLESTFELPPNVREFEVRYPQLATSTVTLANRDGFARVDETTLRWDGSSGPASVTLRITLPTDTVGPGDRGVERAEWAFATAPDVGYSLRYTGTQPRLETETRVSGSGVAAGRMAYMGAYAEETLTVDGERARFVVGEGEVRPDLSRARAYLETAPNAYDFGVRYDEMTVFVLPYDQRGTDTSVLLGGESFGSTFWVTAADANVSTTANAFAHEYVHTRVGDVGNGSAAWLSEAVAEYYGHLSSLNAGVGDDDAFYDDVRAPAYAPNRTAVVLAEQSTWEGSLADYEKGAHVLAALDAEIRQRTGGERTLYDVLRRDNDYDDYAAFRAAVVDATGDSSLGTWLDRYVTTDALPPLPTEPTLYVLGPALDPDDDGLDSGTESRLGTNPFAADTDGDGLPDGRERELGTDPTLADTDDDGYPDGTDPYPTDAARPTPTPTVTATATTGGGDDSTVDGTGGDEAGSTVGSESTDGDARTETETETSVPGFGVGTGAAGVALGVWWRLRRVRGEPQNRQQ